MHFRLVYRGPLAANGSYQEKHKIREAFHPQLKQLWHEYPLSTHYRNYLAYPPEKNAFSVIRKVGDFDFAPLVCAGLKTYAEIDITLLRPGPLGGIVTQSGDIDNRLKTLFDALRYPTGTQELKDLSPGEDQRPFFCLLEDDQLIYSLSVAVDRLLEPVENDSSYVHLLLVVRVRGLAATLGNMGLIV